MSKGEIFDVCIIGSGAAGGVMAKELCEGGAKVVMLEAGREVPPSEFLSHKWPYELPYRGFRGEKQAPFYQGDISKSIAYVDSDDVANRSSARPRRQNPALERGYAALRPARFQRVVVAGHRGRLAAEL